MAVHLPLQGSSQIEASLLMKPSSNIFSQANGSNILKPSQDIVIGIYYLTLMINKNYFISQKWFSSEHDVLSSYLTKKLNLHDPVLIRYSLINAIFKISFNKLKTLNDKKILNNLNNIEIYKVFESKKNHYLITNIGVLVSRKRINSYYNITEFFLETTPGRIIFNLNLRKSIEIK
jgi:DNA-directed RNA polymerase subunit beta'